MKKFYESPVVEITVFDVEDVITASANTNTLTMTDAELNTLVSDIQGAQGVKTNVSVYDSNSYTW
jgi:ribosomal protein S11